MTPLPVARSRSCPSAAGRSSHGRSGGYGTPASSASSSAASAGRSRSSSGALAGLGVELAARASPSGSGAEAGSDTRPRRAARTGDVFAMNGDELVDVDFGALLERHRATGALATLTVAQPPSQFGQVDLTDDDVVTGFHEVSRVPYWVNCGIYVPRRGGARALPGEGRPRDDDVPGARGRGDAARVPAHGHVADGQHAEGAEARRRVRHRRTRSGSRDQPARRSRRGASRSPGAGS